MALLLVGGGRMELIQLWQATVLLPPTLIVYILGRKAGLFPHFQGVATDTVIMLLQLFAIRELIWMYLDFYVTYCL